MNVANRLNAGLLVIRNEHATIRLGGAIQSALEEELHLNALVQKQNFTTLGCKVRILFLKVIAAAVRLDFIAVQNGPNG